MGGGDSRHIFRRSSPSHTVDELPGLGDPRSGVYRSGQLRVDTEPGRRVSRQAGCPQHRDARGHMLGQIRRSSAVFSGPGWSKPGWVCASTRPGSSHPSPTSSAFGAGSSVHRAPSAYRSTTSSSGKARPCIRRILMPARYWIEPNPHLVMIPGVQRGAVDLAVSASPVDVPRQKDARSRVRGEWNRGARPSLIRSRSTLVRWGHGIPRRPDPFWGVEKMVRFDDSGVHVLEHHPGRAGPCCDGFVPIGEAGSCLVFFACFSGGHGYSMT